MMIETAIQVNSSKVSASKLNRAACMLSACLVALDEANMTLPNSLPRMPNGADLGFVYFGAAEAMREAIEDIRAVIDRL